jgi:hypothetical protein
MRNENGGGQEQTAAVVQNRITFSAAFHLTAPPRPEKGYGNGGSVGSVESQMQASHTFHESLGNLAQKQARFPHSHSPAKWSGKVENQQQVSHFPLPLRDDICGLDSSELASLRLRTTPLRGQERKNSPTANTSRFQDHLVLESKPDFRIILRLENAQERRAGTNRMSGRRPQEQTCEPL